MYDHVASAENPVLTDCIQLSSEDSDADAKSEGSVNGSSEQVGMALRLARTDAGIVVEGPEGQVIFRGEQFEVVEDENDFKVIRGPYDEPLLLDSDSRKLRIEYYSAAEAYVISMVNKAKIGFAPDLKEQFLLCYKRLGIDIDEVCGNGAEGFLYDGGSGGKDDLLVPDHNLFSDKDYAQVVDQKGFPKIPGQIV